MDGKYRPKQGVFVGTEGSQRIVSQAQDERRQQDHADHQGRGPHFPYRHLDARQRMPDDEQGCHDIFRAIGQGLPSVGQRPFSQSAFEYDGRQEHHEPTEIQVACLSRSGRLAPD